MPTSISVATQTNSAGTGIGAIQAWGTSDDNRNNPHFDSSTGDITLQFGNLNVPADATINGLEVTVEGQGNNFAATPLIFLDSGGSVSSGIAPSAAFNKTDQVVTYGSSTELWGLSWTSTTANAVIATIDVSTIASGQLFWDFVKITVHYSEFTPTITNFVTLSSGKIIISRGKVTI